MRVIIAGGRKFVDYGYLRTSCLGVFRILKKEGYNTSKEQVTIISGEARGADTLGEQFQEEFDLILKKFKADWNTFKKRAGSIRNGEMGTYAKKSKELGVLIAFWDGKSRGTKNMIDIANEKGLRVFVFRYS